MSDETPKCKDCIHFATVEHGSLYKAWLETSPQRLTPPPGRGGTFCTFHPQWIDVAPNHWCGQLEPTRRWWNS